jgi:hypothetical protein
MQKEHNEKRAPVNAAKAPRALPLAILAARKCGRMSFYLLAKWVLMAKKEDASAFGGR